MQAEDAEVEAALSAAKTRLSAGDGAAARAILERAAAIKPKDFNVLMLLAAACRMQGDLRAALDAITAALVTEPYSFIALLTKGDLLQSLEGTHAAVAAYKAALAVAPGKLKLPPAVQASVAQAERVVQQETQRLYEFLQAELAPMRARFPARELKRVDECMAIFSGRAKPFVHEASLLYFPQLPAIPFHDESQFPWLAQLEQATDMIREELLLVMKEDWGAFHPYIQYAAGAPLGQWKELNHSPAWSAFDLWRDGKKYEANCRRCPGTAALLAGLPMAVQEGHAPTAMFSVLAPHAHIPAHTGSTNARLIVHLPLVLPPRCRYRVGNEHREWQLGKAWVFDDTIEHEAWNDSDAARVLLIFDIWNPLLTETERQLATAMMLARRRFS